MRGAQEERRDLSQVRRRPRVFAFLSMPVDTRLLSHCPHTSPISCSLSGNHIGAKGASVLAAILKETKIAKLKCAAARECSLLCQRLSAR